MSVQEVETRSPEEQLALDEMAFRDQLAYLLDRSPFYREKLGSSAAGVGLGEIGSLPLTEKSELRPQPAHPGGS